MAHEEAKKKNGLCLSTNYINTFSKLKWQCDKMHIFEMNLNNVKYGQWCPDCKFYLSEQKFRECLENITGYKFKKIRPEWLTNYKGNKLELDGYNEELKLAFEYQGIQHTKYTHHFHRNKEKMEDGFKNDKCKADILSKLGIVFLTPDYKLKHHKFEEYIINNLKNTRLDYLVGK